MAERTVCLINTQDGDGALKPRAVGISHGRTKKYLVAAHMNAGVGHHGNLQAFSQKTNAPINLAQPLFTVDIVTILRAVTIAGSPVNGLHDLGTLDVDQVEQLAADAGIALGRYVVFAT